jgi:hypothetical protein
MGILPLLHLQRRCHIAVMHNDRRALEVQLCLHALQLRLLLVLLLRLWLQMSSGLSHGQVHDHRGRQRGFHSQRKPSQNLKSNV